MTTRNITFLVGDPYNPSFATVNERGPHLNYTPQSLNKHIFWGGDGIGGVPLLGCPRKLGSMLSKWVISPTYKWLFLVGAVITH